MTFRAAVIGHPVKHSLSPVMHNAAYKHLGLDWEYEAIDFEADQARVGIKELFSNGYKGLNVTMPHKSLAFSLSTAHGAAARLQSVNTLIVDANGGLHGYCTDGDGFVNHMKSEDIDLVSKSILVVGAGGASRAICDALVQLGAKVFVTARKLDQALNVVDSVMAHQTIGQSRIKGSLDIIDWSSRNEYVPESDLIVNATPVGMSRDGKTDQSTPIDTSVLNPSQVVVDSIYYPLQTSLLAKASEIGCRTFNGLGMLIAQGALAFTIMTGQDAPVEIMKNAIMSKISDDESK